jgi:hypothetical protein
MKLPQLLILLLIGLSGAIASQGQTTATPVISLASGSYVMPQNTTISDGTSGASILWCYVTTGTCTPSTSYTTTIYVDPATTETICANAQASGDTKSATVCNSYTNETQTATPVISLASGSYPMPQNTTISDSTSGASILWCYVTTGTCTPSTSYTTTIYVDPATTETICANATASGHTQSATACNSYTNHTPAATPVISLASGTYVMPQNTTISDSTSGASILWCYVNSGTCTPSTAYSTTIYVDPASTETICANATASGYTQSATVCNSYVAGSGAINFSYSSTNGTVTITTSLQNANIFYTLDGSTATEASRLYTAPLTLPSTDCVAPCTVNAVAVSMGSVGAYVQQGQTKRSNWKTQLACTTSGTGACVSGYNSGDAPFASPLVEACGTAGGCGVQGIPTGVAFNSSVAVPSAGGGSTAAELTETDDNLSGAGSGFQVLWPYNTGSDNTGTGCDSCTTMVEDFYLWPAFTGTSGSSINPANVENWELDMNQWNLGLYNSGAPAFYGGASMQCSVLDGGWQYNGQTLPGWTNFSPNINHDCQLPFGTLDGNLTASATSFTVTPNATVQSGKTYTAATVEAGMIVVIDGEEIFCQTASGNTCSAAIRGWGGTAAAAHSSGALYAGSVHVQYHVTFKPGDTSVCQIPGSPATPVECVFIDYLILNNNYYGSPTYVPYLPTNIVVQKNGSNPTWWTSQSVSGTAGYSSLTVPYSNSSIFGIDRIYDQKQIDQFPGLSYPATTGEYIDRDNVTASFGILASQSYTVP